MNDLAIAVLKVKSVWHFEMHAAIVRRFGFAWLAAMLAALFPPKPFEAPPMNRAERRQRQRQRTPGGCGKGDILSRWRRYRLKNK